MKNIVFCFLFLLTTQVLAAPVGVVLILKGEATFNKKPIKVGDRLADKGELAVGDKSYLKIKLEDAEHTIVLGGNSKGSIDFNQEKEMIQFNLVGGIARWVSGQIQNKSSAAAGIKTKNATMGIRGTDFLATYHEAWEESEIVCFDGQVEFLNSANPSNFRRIKKHQWGGIGGRFGSTIAKVIDLPQDKISHFNTVIPLE